MNHSPADNLPHTRRISLWTWVALAAILLLGGYFRFTGLNWDDFTHLHPDERFLTSATAKLETVSDPFLYLRTSESPLNPYNKGEGFYVYGNFPMTVTKYVSAWAERWRTPCHTDPDPRPLCRNDLTGYDGVHLVGRILSALLDLVAVLFTFFIGQRLYSNRVGLLAALFMATAVMPIQQSHFYTMDNWAAGLTAAALYATVRASEDATRKRWWALFGILLGLTVSSRVNVAPLALVAGVAGIIWLAHRMAADRLQRGWRYLTTAAGNVDIQYILLGGMLAALLSLVVFRVGQPYAFADRQLAREAYMAQTGQEPSWLYETLYSFVGFNPQWQSNMEEIQRLQAPEANFPPALQWVDRPNIIFPLTNMLLYGMGLLAGTAAWLGFCWALWRTVRGRADWWQHAVLVSWVGVYFLFMATRWVKSIRYFLPIYPALFVLGAWLLWELWRRADGRLWAKILVGIALVATPLSNVLWANAFTEIYRQPLTRVAASDWMYDNIPSGATLLYTTADGQARELQLPLMGANLQPGGSPQAIPFTLPQPGTVTAVRLNYVRSASGLAETTQLQASLNGPYGGGAISQGELTAAVDGTRTAATIALSPVALDTTTAHLFYLQVPSAGTAVLAETSVLTSEHWDDALPARMNGRDPYSQYFRGLSTGAMPTTNPDSDQKRLDLYNWLQEADYVVLTSQRSIWSVPRLPLTFPLMNRYYEALFNGELGFEMVAQFHGDIHIGPLYVSDTGGKLGWGALPQIGWPGPGWSAAEEAFSVYDHPPVWIFKKTADFNVNRMVAALGGVDVSNVVTMNPLEATNAPNGLMLSPAAQAIQQQNGTFRDVFNVDGVLSNHSFVAAVVWWLAVVALGWLAFPLCFALFPGLADRGFALGRILALLLVSYFAWLTASVGVLWHTRGTLLLGVALLALISGLVLARQGQAAAFRTYVRQHWRLLLMLEGVGLGLYLLQLIVRLGNPDAWHVIWGGEKPMDMSYFTAVMKSTTFPPYDPWLAGGYINYYYYGFVYVGALAKLLGIVPAMAYNLILPMLYSFTGTAVFSLTYSLVSQSPNLPTSQSPTTSAAPLLGASAATVLAMVLGNLGEFGLVVSVWARASILPETSNGLLRVLDGGWRVLSGSVPAAIYPGDWFWTASRAIVVPGGEVGPITEFPFFTFLYGDLHAHMIALPLALLALGWAIALALRPHPFSRLGGLAYGVVGALAIGVLYPTNSWDFPTYIVLAALAIVAYDWRRVGFGLPMLGQSVVKAAALGGAAVLLFWPFWQNFGSGYGSVRMWEGSHTSLGNYLTIYGLFLWLILTFLVVEFKRWGQRWNPTGLERYAAVNTTAVFGLFGVAGVMFTLLVRGYEVAPLVLSVVLLAGVLAVWGAADPAKRIVHTLIASALALTMVVEVVVLDGDIGRMNTVFKFYMQVWILLSVAGGAAVAWLWPTIAAQWGETRQQVWKTILVALVLAAALYPVLATRAKWAIRENPDQARTTLNGLDFMRYVTYGDQGQTVALNYDYAAIQWMQRNISGSPVIAEAHSDNPYRSIGNRIAMYTGLPSIVGWDWHQRQQRATTPGSLISQRISDVALLYNTEDIQLAQQILAKYHVGYIYVGQLEWVYYAPTGLQKFDQMTAEGLLEEVYRNSGTSIYAVRP